VVSTRGRREIPHFADSVRNDGGGFFRSVERGVPSNVFCRGEQSSHDPAAAVPRGRRASEGGPCKDMNKDEEKARGSKTRPRSKSARVQVQTQEHSQERLWHKGNPRPR